MKNGGKMKINKTNLKVIIILSLLFLLIIATILWMFDIGNAEATSYISTLLLGTFIGLMESIFDVTGKAVDKINSNVDK